MNAEIPPMQDSPLHHPHALSRRRLLQWLALGSAASLGACALKPSMLAPEVSVRNVTLSKLDFSGLDLLVDLRVKNPNDVELPITGIEYAVMLQNVRVADGRQARAVTLPALGETDMPLQVTVNLLKTATELVPLLLNKRGAPKALSYRVDGRVKLDWWYMPSIPFNKIGEVALPFA